MENNIHEPEKKPQGKLENVSKRALATLVLVLLLVLIFIVQNYEKVTIRFLAWDLSTSRALLIFITLLLGAVAGWAGHAFRKKARS